MRNSQQSHTDRRGLRDWCCRVLVSQFQNSSFLKNFDTFSQNFTGQLIFGVAGIICVCFSNKIIQHVYPFVLLLFEFI